ncbi:MAG: hypothetical protein HQ483_05570 [Rhodospirillales bacterium]|nr:hypothetical protein [Rhodospirillales bacterium]
MAVKPLIFCALSFFSVAVFSTVGQAAPQILGLVATATPLPLTCSDGQCTVEVSGVCLQQARPAPLAGTPYQAAAGAELRLIVETENGLRRSRNIAALARFTAKRTFNAIAVTVLQSAIDEMGGAGAHAMLAIGPGVSLLPVASADDLSPQSQQEISDVTGPLRTVAEAAVGRDPLTLGTTRLLAHMVNRLPMEAAFDAERIGAVRAQTLDARTRAAMPAASRQAEQILETCRELLRVERQPSLRACLGYQHDILNAEITHSVWRSLRPGS